MRVRLVYYQVDEDLEFTFNHDYSADALDAIVTDLLTQYAPWAKRSAERQRMNLVHRGRHCHFRLQATAPVSGL